MKQLCEGHDTQKKRMYPPIDKRLFHSVSLWETVFLVVMASRDNLEVVILRLATMSNWCQDLHYFKATSCHAGICEARNVQIFDKRVTLSLTLASLVSQYIDRYG